MQPDEVTLEVNDGYVVVPNYLVVKEDTTVKFIIYKLENVGV
jgi:hypothetical protein